MKDHGPFNYSEYESEMSDFINPRTVERRGPIKLDANEVYEGEWLSHKNIREGKGKLIKVQEHHE